MPHTNNLGLLQFVLILSQRWIVHIVVNSTLGFSVLKLRIYSVRTKCPHKSKLVGHLIKLASSIEFGSTIVTYAWFAVGSDSKVMKFLHIFCTFMFGNMISMHPVVVFKLLSKSSLHFSTVLTVTTLCHCCNKKAGIKITVHRSPSLHAHKEVLQCFAGWLAVGCKVCQDSMWDQTLNDLTHYNFGLTIVRWQTVNLSTVNCVCSLTHWIKDLSLECQCNEVTTPTGFNRRVNWINMDLTHTIPGYQINHPTHCWDFFPQGHCAKL